MELLFLLAGLLIGGSVGATWRGPARVHNRDAVMAYGREWVNASAYDSLRRQLDS